MTTSMVMEMNLGENGGPKLSGNGGGGGRRKTKGSELKQKKNKQCQRGMGVEQLERLREQEEWKKMTEVPSLHPFALPAFNSSVAFTTSSTTSAGQFRHVQPPTSAMMFHGIGIHGANLFSRDRVADPSVIGSSNVGFRFENSKELSSIPNYVKCASDGCGVCQKKKRIHGGSNGCSVNPVQASTVASESAFSLSGRVISERRSKLTAESMQVCVCLKDYLDGVERIQNSVSLEGPLLTHIEEFIHIEEEAMSISPPMTEVDEEDDYEEFEELEDI